MKKTLLLLSFLSLIGSAFAQSVTFGLKGGVNFSTLTASGSGVSINTTNKTGFNVGGVVDIGLGDFSIQPGLLYSTKGGGTGTLGYLEVPVNLLYNVTLGEGKLFFGAGPYLGYGVSASDGAKFGSGTSDISNPDFGINAIAGYRLTSGLAFSAGYGFGLSNLNSNSSNSITLKNNVASISISYFFSSK